MLPWQCFFYNWQHRLHQLQRRVLRGLYGGSSVHAMSQRKVQQQPSANLSQQLQLLPSRDLQSILGTDLKWLYILLPWQIFQQRWGK